MNIMNELLILVRQHIDDGSITIADLARQCDCSREYVYKLLRGGSCPTVAVAEKLAKAVDAEFVLKNRSKRKISA